MKDHETRRKIIREWMALPNAKRQTEGPAKRIPSQSTRSEPEISARSVPEINGMAFASRWQVVIARYSGVRNHTFANQIIDLYDGAVCETKARSSTEARLLGTRLSLAIAIDCRAQKRAMTSAELAT